MKTLSVYNDFVDNVENPFSVKGGFQAHIIDQSKLDLRSVQLSPSIWLSTIYTLTVGYKI